MREVNEYAMVEEARCIGDRICENICPSGAITMMERKARVDEDKCVACKRCADACGEDAIRFVPLRKARILGVNYRKVDQTRLMDLCRRANMEPEEPVCPCTFTQAREVAAAILMGADSLEKVVRMTGARSHCAMWCMAPLQRLLRASGQEVLPPPGFKWYPVDVALWDVPQGVSKNHPQYRLEEDQKVFSDLGLMDNFLAKTK